MIVAWALALLSACSPEPSAPETGEQVPEKLPGQDQLTATGFPEGFQDELVLEVAAPTAIEFTPDGRMLIATQPGQLMVWDGQESTLALDMVEVTCSRIEQGMIGITVDPNFIRSRYFYLYYTFDDDGECVNRVSRFALPDDNRVNPSTEKVLLDQIPSEQGNHNGGGLEFGPDGHLYVGVGDSGCDYAGGGCDGENDAARDLHALVGKVLRITKEGGIPGDNPFLGTNSTRCNLKGFTTPDKVCQETYLWGLRNPFRFAFDADGDRLYVNDVGQFDHEEIDQAVPGADYGWNIREGRCATGSQEDCGDPPEGITNPIFDYSHDEPGGCAAITGGAFVPEGLWPEPYAGVYLFGDFVCGAIFQLVEESPGRFDRSAFAVGLGGGSASHLEFGPFQNTQALYYASYQDGGQIRRISYGGDPSSS